MRKILLIERDGEKMFVLAKRPKFADAVQGIEEKVPGVSISRYSSEFRAIRELRRLENGEEGDLVGFVTTVEEGEVELYKYHGYKTYKHINGVGYRDIILHVSKEMINILKLIYSIK